MCMKDYKFRTKLFYDSDIIKTLTEKKIKVVPNIIFIDLLYQYLEMQGEDIYETKLYDIEFRRAIIIEGEKNYLLEFNLFTGKAGYYNVTCRYACYEGDTDLSWCVGFTGKLQFNNPIEKDTMKLPELKEPKDMLEDVYLRLEEKNIQYSSSMHVGGGIYKQDNGILVKINCNPNIERYEDDFVISPFLLESVLVIGEDYAEQVLRKKDNVGIPLDISSMKSFRLYRKVEDYVYLIIKKDSITFEKSGIGFDADLYDKDGIHMAELCKLSIGSVTREQLDELIQWENEKRYCDVQKEKTYCGLFCKICPSYIASLPGSKVTDEMARSFWINYCNLDIGDGTARCDGCMVNNGRLVGHCNGCGVRKCAMKKGILLCEDCSKYPCSEIKDVEEKTSYLRKTAR